MDFERTESYEQQKESLIIISEHLTGKTLRPMQCRVSLALLNGYDVFCSAATSSGKTLAFLAAILASHGGIALIISPLIKLLMQQASAIQSWGIATAALTDEYIVDNPDIYKRIGNGEIRVIWCGPERLLAKNGPIVTAGGN